MIDWTIGNVILSIIGTIANIKKKKWGFVIWLFTNTAWFVYSLAIAQYSRAILDFVYLCLAIYGLLSWHHADKIKTTEVAKQ
jgi:nicotinamide riboside transporter PnuC